MNKRRAKLTLTAVVLVSSILTMNVYADGCGKMCGKMKSGHMNLEEKFSCKALFIMENEEELGLSEQQIDSIKELRMTAKKDIIRKKAEIDIVGLDIKKELWEDTINVAVIDALIDQKYDFKKEKQKILIKAYASLKNVLTEDQKQKMKNIFKQKKTMREKKSK
ncbi:MAG: hypothetical protein ABH869_06495 [Candidatus Omnitrophota bacterium]